MADPAGRSSGNTTLFIGTLSAKIGLFGTKAEPGRTTEFDTAGPSGGVLKFEQRGVASPVRDVTVEQPDVPVAPFDALGDAPAPAMVRTDPGRPGAGFEARVDALEPPAEGRVDGEFRRVLVEQGTDVVVEADQVRKGVRLDDGSFVDCTGQLDAIVERTKLDRMDVVAVIDSTQIRRERVIGSYYVGGQDKLAPVVLRLFYEALRARRQVAIVKYTTRSRQQLGVIAPHARTGTLVLLSLVFAEDFREPPARALAVAKARVSASNVAAMGELLGALHGTVDDLDAMRDDAISLREELLARAKAGEMTTVVEPLPAADAEPDLEDALRESLNFALAGKG